jgi:hypothetical protein
MEWIDIKEKLPHSYSYVLVLSLNPGAEPKPISIAMLVEKSRWTFLGASADENWVYGAWSDITYPMDVDDITHWLPLPTLPKE